MPRLRGAEVPPAHKNLYVLNLPLDVTTDQLAALFATYGTVVHCVILAMLDAQARRRGFIDMSSPQEAKEAIEGLNGFVWHGYPIEV
ncbi:RNA-binding domain-containing protein, partial [Violaceomyces palustris]